MKAGHDTKYPSTNPQEMHIVRVPFNVNHRFDIIRSSGCLKCDFLSLFELQACFINAWGVKKLQCRGGGKKSWNASLKDLLSTNWDHFIRDCGEWLLLMECYKIKVFFAVDMSPFLRGDLFLNFYDSVRFECLERVTSTIAPIPRAPIENNGTISEGINIAAWDSQDVLKMLHELWEHMSSTKFKSR